jgi:membrane associated rhomboid family serine protease
VREPIFNVAPAVIGLVVVLLGIHLAVYQLVQSEATRESILEAFAFIPARELAPAAFAGSEAARFWSPLSYAFLHADWTHVGVNVLWLVAFGSPLAWRFGSGRFLLFSAVGAVAGALAHFAIDPSDATGMVGASAAISAQMGGVIRFAFNGNTSLLGAPGGAAAYRMPALPLAQTLRRRCRWRRRSATRRW